MNEQIVYETMRNRLTKEQKQIQARMEVEVRSILSSFVDTLLKEIPKIRTRYKSRGFAGKLEATLFYVYNEDFTKGNHNDVMVVVNTCGIKTTNYFCGYQHDDDYQDIKGVHEKCLAILEHLAMPDIEIKELVIYR